MCDEDRQGEKMPKNFPEYSIMYKTLSRQVKKLKQQTKDAHESQAEEIKLKIERYESEIIKIKKMFPSNYFEGVD
jgi:hypothetical protein